MNHACAGCVDVHGDHERPLCGESADGDRFSNPTYFRRDEGSCERCLAALRSRAGASRVEVQAGATGPIPQASSDIRYVPAPLDHEGILALLRKRKEFETELARLINRLSLEGTFGNRADWELSALAWELLTRG